MRVILTIDRVGIIQVDDCRYCDGRRAEAIVSALGVTDRYTNGVASSEYPAADPKTFERQLVIGKYPLPFFRELAAKMPEVFFGTFLKEFVVEQMRHHHAYHGSLLPFRHGMELMWVPNPTYRKFFWAIPAHSSLRSRVVNLEG